MEIKKGISKGIFNWAFFWITVASLVFLNIISSFLNYRIDMTEDGRFTLADATVEFLGNKEKFKNRLNIKVYLEGNLPAELRSFRNAIEDKLIQFKEIAGDRIEFEFIDPNVGTDAEKRSLFESLFAKNKGIIPMELMLKKDGELSKMMIWPGAVIDYGGSTVQYVQFLPGSDPGFPYQSIEAIKQNIENSLNNLEYILVSSIRRAIQEEKPRIAFLQGHGELDYKQTARVRALIAPYYAIADVNIKDSLAALDNVDGLIIAGPKAAFSDKELYIIDQYVMRGGKLMCMLDALTLNEDTLKTYGNTHTMRNETGLDDMLFDYGLKLNDNLVIDEKSVPIAVPYAGEVLELPYFYNVLASPTNHPIAKNVEPVSLKYTSEIQMNEVQNVTVKPILTSSSNSNVTGLAPMISMGMAMNFDKNNPELNQDPSNVSNKKILAAIAEGNFVSRFRNRIVDEYVSAVKNDSTVERKYVYQEKSSKPGKVLLIGNSRFMANSVDSMLNKEGTGFMYRASRFNNLRMDEDLAKFNKLYYFGNQEFFQNMVDYMMGDVTVLELRSRQVDIRELDREKVKQNATFYKLINIIIPVMSIALLALTMTFLRKRKYTR
jgi:gliding-associated putative ABC transporter substrate-binding component GldG